MRRSTVFSLFLVLLALLGHGVQGETLEENCQKIIKPNLSFDYCMKVFQTDPKSRNADLRGLGIISTKQIIAKATYIKSYTQKLLDSQRKGGDIRYTRGLQDCVEIYSQGLGDAYAALSGLESKSYFESHNAMSSVFDAPSTCEDGFREFQLKSPLMQLNNEFAELAAIPLHIVALLDI
ncbi:hypothetical protein ACHQM5_026468 [Ranunculus cassubicifolius]